MNENENKNTESMNDNNNEKGETMNENTESMNTESMNTMTADELNEPRGYWLKPQTTAYEIDGKPVSVRLVPVAFQTVRMIPEFVANDLTNIHAPRVNPTNNDRKSGLTKACAALEAELFGSGAMIHKPQVFPNGVRISGVIDADYYVKPNDKGRFDRQAACGRAETIATMDWRELVSLWGKYRAAETERDNLNEADKKRRAQEQEQADIYALASMFESFGMEPDKALKRAKEQYRKCKQDKANREAAKREAANA